MTDWAFVILLLTSLLNALAGVLAWGAKLRWSKEFANAKDETIKAKEAQIESLKTQIEVFRELTPMKVREYFLCVKSQLEEFIEKLQQELQEARAEIEQRSKQIDDLRLEGRTQAEKVKQLTNEKIKLEEITDELEARSSKLLTEIKAGDALFSLGIFDEQTMNEMLSSIRDAVTFATRIASLIGKSGEVCQTSGLYKCKTHESNVITLAKGNRFPPCLLGGRHATTWIYVPDIIITSVTKG